MSALEGRSYILPGVKGQGLITMLLSVGTFNHVVAKYPIVLLALIEVTRGPATYEREGGKSGSDLPTLALLSNTFVTRPSLVFILQSNDRCLIQLLIT